MSLRRGQWGLSHGQLSSQPNFRTVMQLPSNTHQALHPYSFLSSPQSLPMMMYFLSPLICLFWTFHRNRITQLVAFCSVCFGLTHASDAPGFHSSLRLNSFPWYRYITLTRSSADRHLGYFYLSGTMNGAAQDIHVQVVTYMLPFLLTGTAGCPATVTLLDVGY